MQVDVDSMCTSENRFEDIVYKRGSVSSAKARERDASNYMRPRVQTVARRALFAVTGEQARHRAVHWRPSGIVLRRRQAVSLGIGSSRCLQEKDGIPVNVCIKVKSRSLQSWFHEVWWECCGRKRFVALVFSRRQKNTFCSKLLNIRIQITMICVR